jgi:DNA-binding transcriptional MerR regulator
MAPEADPLLSIGVFSHRSRLSVKALRLYDRLGVLTPAEVEPSSGYRRYRTSQLGTARLIAMLRRLDMPLNKVAEIVEAPDAEHADLIGDYWAQVDSRVAFQRELAAYLQARHTDPGVRFNGFVVDERWVPETWVLSKQANLLVGDLVAWIGDTTSGMRKAAAEHGGRLGHDRIIFHGEVNEDSDGPVELCIPIDNPAVVAGTAVSTSYTIRLEPGHRVAYVRLSKAQTQYPQILTAYDAVTHWIDEHGRASAGPPREIYLAEYCAVEPGDAVCDVAYPIK